MARRRRRLGSARTASAALVCLGACLGCSDIDPKPLSDVGFMSRAQTQRNGNLTVSTAVLSDRESREAFGVDLAGQGIQPVWLKLDNRDSVPYWLLPISIDPRYYSPLEVAWHARSGLSKAAQQTLERHLCEQQIPLVLRPDSASSGFVFATVHEGARQVAVELVAPGQRKSFLFFDRVPGIQPAMREVTAEELYPPQEIVSYDECGLRQALARLACCTTNKAGTQDGDFLNVVLVGDARDIAHAFVNRGWDVAERLDSASAWQSLESFLFGTTYLYAPMSALYAYGRSQDACFQKARRTIDDRTHLRLWLTPMRFEGRPVWVGAITRDIGIFFTLKAPPLMLTHKIDSDVDDTRDYLVQDLLASRRVSRIGFVQGVGPSTPAHTRQNLTGDEMFTDGLRAVFFLNSEPLDPAMLAPLHWDEPGNPLYAPEQQRR